MRKGEHSALGKRIFDFVHSDANYLEVRKCDANNAVNILRQVYDLRGIFRSLPHRPGRSWIFKGDQFYYQKKRFKDGKRIFAL